MTEAGCLESRTATTGAPVIDTSTQSSLPPPPLKVLFRQTSTQLSFPPPPLKVLLRQAGLIVAFHHSWALTSSMNARDSSGLSAILVMCSKPSLQFCTSSGSSKCTAPAACGM
jgi:hypothetical protein